MLILTRKPGQSLYIGDDVKITIVEIKGNQIRVGIDAPRSCRIYREEIYLQIMEENKSAASAASPDLGDLKGLAGAMKGRKEGGTSALTGMKISSNEKGNQTKSGSEKSVEVVVRKKKSRDKDE